MPRKTRSNPVVEKSAATPASSATLTQISEPVMAPTFDTAAFKDAYFKQMGELMAKAIPSSLEDEILDLKLFAEEYEQAELAVQKLNMLKSMLAMVEKKLPEVCPELVALKAEREELGNVLRKGYWTGGINVRALPPNHSISLRLAEVSNKIRDIEQIGYAYLNQQIDEQKKFCEQMGYLTLEAEISASRDAYGKSRTNQSRSNSGSRAR